MLTSKQKDIIIESVKTDFELGHHSCNFNDLKYLVTELGDFTNCEHEAANYYLELKDLGPAGFYEEFPELDWDEDFIKEYSH